MPGQKISSLIPVNDLQSADQFPLARSGSTYKITGDKLASKVQLDALAAAVDSAYALKTTVSGMSATVDNKFALKTTVAGMSSYIDTKFIPKPTPASNGQVLTYNSSTSTWIASDKLPLGTNGQVLTYSGVTNSWVAGAAPSVLPTGSSGQVLTYNGSTSTWVASASLPSGSNGQILTYSGSTNTWVASAAPVGDVVPVGTVTFFAASTAPTGWFECAGQQLNKTVYVDLFNAIGYTFGGSGNIFYLPDLRGEFIRGWDHGRGVDSGRGLGSNQLDSYKSHKHGVRLSHEVGGGKDSQGYPGIDGSAPIVFHSETETDDSICWNDGRGNFMSSSGGTETRPRNVALLPCIKYASVSNVTQVGLSAQNILNSLNGYLSESSFTGSGKQSLTTNGYQKLPGGVILQWGTFTATKQDTVGSPQIVNLPISFPNAMWYVNVSPDGAQYSSVPEEAYLDFSTANKTTLSQIGVYTNNYGPVKFFAIGN